MFDIHLTALYVAHEQAYTLKKYLHRDLSNNNILLWFFTDSHGKVQVIGILNDWDLCKAIEDFVTASRPGRSVSRLSPYDSPLPLFMCDLVQGTWQFMSARLLRNPGKKHKLADDLEAFVHVLCWMCLRFYKHILTGYHTGLLSHIISIFETREEHAQKGQVGGGAKYHAMLQGQDVVGLTAEETPLAKLLKELSTICRDHYQATEPKAESEKDQLRPLDKTGYMSILRALAKPSAPSNVHDEQPPVSNSSTPDTEQPTRLSSHRDVMSAFARAMLAGDEEWRPLVKTGDQFDNLDHKSAMMQRNAERSAASDRASASSKRSLEEEDAEGRPGPSKRSRSGFSGAVASSELEAVDEE